VACRPEFIISVRSDASGDPTFTQFLARANGTVQEALIHQRMPFHKLVAVLNPPREPGRTPPSAPPILEPTEAETKMMAIWRDVLQVREIAPRRISSTSAGIP
jgi:hypothetical protein